jgi:hypothetical protein
MFADAVHIPHSKLHIFIAGYRYLFFLHYDNCYPDNILCGNFQADRDNKDNFKKQGCPYILGN